MQQLLLLSLGSQAVHAVGVPVAALRAAGLIVASLLAGAAVSFSGLIGFIGLMVPHVARRFVGHDLRRVIPVSALWGAAFTVFTDLLARTLFAPYELPVGILMALIGGPFFIFLLMKGRGYRDERERARVQEHLLRLWGKRALLWLLACLSGRRRHVGPGS